MAEPACLLGQTVVAIDGGSGLGLAIARTAKAEGARVIIAGREAGLDDVAEDIGAEATAAFDPDDVGRLDTFLAALPTRVDHVVLSPGVPYVARIVEDDLTCARGAVERLLLPLSLARFAAREMPDGGSLLFVWPSIGGTIPAMLMAALPVLVANLALETAPVRINLIAVAGADRLDGVATLAVHLMTDTAVTGATYEVSGAGPSEAAGAR
jgi:NAD(P)-dependent dehydrogenase (short-subunit alcohol dehydrogenase family)